MKKLFLASFASVSLELIKDMLPKPAHELKVAFIPTAGNSAKNKDFVYVDRDVLVAMGMSVIDVDLAQTQGTMLEEKLSTIDVILVAGGNSFYLLDQMHQSGFDVLLNKLFDRGVIYIGSSAGSVVCCPTIEHVRAFDDPAEAPTLTNFAGLNLVDFVIFPHAHKEKYQERITIAEKEMQDKGINVVKLTDNQAIKVIGDEWEVLEL